MRKALTLATAIVLSASAALAEFTAADPARIHMVVWRGCEEACSGFVRYFEDRGLPVEVEVTDVSRDRALLPSVQDTLRDEKPDLVVTWGTSVSRGIMGTMEDFGTQTALGDIPILFMIVADPVNSNLIESYSATGRPTVTGVRNRVPEDVQLRLLFQYLHPKKLGIINSPKELNSTINTQALRRLADEMEFELLEREYTLDAEDLPNPAEIPALIADLKAAGAEAIYVGSSSFNLDNQDAFTAAAVAEGLPVFSAYAQMVTESDALMAIASAYVNVGKLAARQAERILLEGSAPGEMPVEALDRFSVFMNMRIAQELGIYPPMQLITVAEIVE